MGIPEFHFLNQALVMKSFWELLTHDAIQSSQWSTLIQSLYLFHKNTWTVTPNSSWTWKSILKIRHFFWSSTFKVPGSGTSINIFTDPWIPGLPSFF